MAQDRDASGMLESRSGSTKNILDVKWQKQALPTWCGPATLAMVSSYLGVGWSGSEYDQQSAAANLLGTTDDGTAWYGRDNMPNYPDTSSYPMQDALNYLGYQQGKKFHYDVVGLPDTPTKDQESAFL